MSYGTHCKNKPCGVFEIAYSRYDGNTEQIAIYGMNNHESARRLLLSDITADDIKDLIFLANWVLEQHEQALEAQREWHRCNNAQAAMIRGQSPT